MRKLVMMISVLWFVTLPAFGAEPVTVVVIEIKNMACAVCARTVIERLIALPGVQDVEINLKTDTAHVVMAPGRKPDVERIRKTVAVAGFKSGVVMVQSKRQNNNEREQTYRNQRR